MKCKDLLKLILW